MIEVPSMVMIGAAGRNVGKTEFACSVIRKFADRYDVIAAKVTTINQRDGKCPRGGEGCGTCSSIDEDFVITTETCADSPKDTSRLLAAGAQKVYWLRAMKDSLEEACRALLEAIGPGRLIVCESNSLRHVVKPGLFLMVKDSNNGSLKPSAQAVVDHADMVVQFDNKSFVPGPERVCLDGDRWKMQPVKEPIP